MKNLSSLILLGSFLLLSASCKKIIDTNNPKSGEYFLYTIHQGEHYADNDPYLSVQYDQLKFSVKFDSTAIYQTTDPANQEDINKLYGFSDNSAAHQQFSARFGWNWTRNALRLYAYVYNNGERSSLEITPVSVGNDHICSIKITGNKYIFAVDNISVEMNRTSTTPKATGYKLYPYFGGDEVAPHDVHVWIKE